MDKGAEEMTTRKQLIKRVENSGNFGSQNSAAIIEAIFELKDTLEKNLKELIKKTKSSRRSTDDMWLMFDNLLEVMKNDKNM